MQSVALIAVVCARSLAERQILFADGSLRTMTCLSGRLARRPVTLVGGLVAPRGGCVLGLAGRAGGGQGRSLLPSPLGALAWPALQT